MLPGQGRGFRPWSGELRSHRLCWAAKKKIIIKDLRIDQIWISDLEEDPSLVFGLTLAFLLHAYKEIGDQKR